MVDLHEQNRSRPLLRCRYAGSVARQVHIASKHRDVGGVLRSRQVDELGVGQANLVRAEMLVATAECCRQQASNAVAADGEMLKPVTPALLTPALSQADSEIGYRVRGLGMAGRVD